MKRHPLDALTLVSLAFVLVAGAVWGMWYLDWEPVSFVVAGPLLLVLLGVVGLFATFVAARQASRRNREQRTPVAAAPVDEPVHPDTDTDTDTDTEPAPDDTRTLTLDDLTRPSDEGEDKR